MRRHIPPLAALLAAFTLLVALHTAFTPVFEAPDEVWHYAYVRWIAEGHGLPSLADDASGAYQEAAQPPLYYAIAALVSRPFVDDDLEALRWHNPGFGTQAPGTTPDNKGMLIHTQNEAWPWEGAALAIHATRLTSWFFGLVAVLAAWGLGQTAFGSRRGALLTAALVAFQPQFVFLSSVINNDSAAAALATTALWLACRTVARAEASPVADSVARQIEVTRPRALGRSAACRPAPCRSATGHAAGLQGEPLRAATSAATGGWRAALALGLVVGLGILTKTSLLLLVPLGAASLVLAALRRCAPDTRQARARHALRDVALYLVGLAAVAGWWYVRNWVRYGDALGLSRHTQTPWGRGTTATLAELVPELPLVLRSFWGAYGWGHVTWPNAVYVALWVAALPTLIAGVSFLVRGWAAAIRLWGMRAPWRVTRPTAAVLLANTLAALWCAGIAGALLRWMQQVEAPHGRLLFPALGAWALLLTLGLQTIGHAASRLGRLASASLIGAGAFLAALAPGARIAASFAPPRLDEPEQVAARCAAPADVTFGGQAQLICAEVTPQRVQPGETVEVRACWTARAQMQTDYTVFVHLLGPAAERVSERHTYPGLGRFPTTLWPVGRAFCDTYRLTVESWAETPLTYRLAVGLFDTATGDRPAATNAVGRPYEPPIVGHVTVAAPPGSPAPTGYHPVGETRIADGQSEVATLLGYVAPERATSGATVEVTLYWEATTAPEADYIAFVHLWRPGDTVPLAQDDGQPRDGWFPTSRWATGDVVVDAHVLTLPANLPSGRYQLWTGMYRPADGTRLTATGSEGPVPDDLIPLATLVID